MQEVATIVGGTNSAESGKKRMNEKAAQARREYQREWARRNPEKIKAAQNRYWEKRAEQQNEPQPKPEPQQ